MKPDVIVLEGSTTRLAPALRAAGLRVVVVQQVNQPATEPTTSTIPFIPLRLGPVFSRDEARRRSASCIVDARLRRRRMR